MTPDTSDELRRRVAELIDAWRIDVERMVETGSSVLGFGRRDGQPVVLKIVKKPGEDWRSGAVLEAFGGHGVVRVYAHVDGAMVLEWLRPGTSLASVAINESDDRATDVLARVIGQLAAREPVSTVPTIEEWGTAFERHAAGGHGGIPEPLLTQAHRAYASLCESQSRRRLLHGDLHHYNVLFDADRGWLAIDPKGVVGELEYELGAMLRNPSESPRLFTDPSVIRSRVTHLAGALDLDAERVLGWGFAQAVLAAIWLVEDGRALEPDHPWIALAMAIRPMLTARWAVP